MQKSLWQWTISIRVMRKFGRKYLIKILFIFIFLWMISPVMIPDDYSGLTGKKKEVAEAAIRETDKEWGLLIQRFSIKNITKCNSGWEVEVIEHTIFNIPVVKATHTVVPSISKVNKYHAISGSFRYANPYAFWVILFSILSTNLIIFSPLILLIYYLVKKRMKMI